MEAESSADQQVGSSEFNLDDLFDDDSQGSTLEITDNSSDEVEQGSSCGSNLPLMNQEITSHPQEYILDRAAENNITRTPQDSLIDNNRMGIVSPPFINQPQPSYVPLITPLRCQELPNQQQVNNEVPVMTNEPQFHNYNMQPDVPSMELRYQFNQFEMANTVFEPPHGFETMPVPSLPLRFPEFPQPPQTPHVLSYSRPETCHPQELATQNDINRLVISQQSPFLNSETNQRGILGLESSTGKRRFEIGESSSQYKRYRVEPATHEQLDWNLIDFQAKLGIPDSLGPMTTNSIYDPLFEGIGLPIDPHLRMLALR
ncbi:hypothetical protein JCGZ_11996 [Jatropha curcas]|uniref:Uncharacterized protein n=1 Tax=Jatropha curcas TaxID=180498 RepID=A0A067KLR5_JATCU|nr:uncharacterized protein LOC110010032 [Jatropha curcas]KDP32704.1 hypothetical protein JCGZ_11996 [Jatropha curcas]